MEDRSSIEVSFVASGAASEVRLTAAASALLASSPPLRWVVSRAQELRLPSPEFEVEVGVKVERGYGHALEMRLLPEAVVEQAAKSVMSRADVITPGGELVKVSVRLVAVELLFTWRRIDPWLSRDQVSIPCSFPVAVLENHAQNESAWRSRVRFVMTELVLARYGLDSYRDLKLAR